MGHKTNVVVVYIQSAIESLLFSDWSYTTTTFLSSPILWGLLGTESNFQRPRDRRDATFQILYMCFTVDPVLAFVS